MNHPLRRRPSRINQRNFKLAIVAAGIAVVAGFFVYEFKFLRPPTLTVTAPARDIAVSESSYEARGRTDPEADATVNGRPLFSGEAGEFAERLQLVKGVNKLEFEARNRYGKTTTAIRYIIVE